MLHLGKNSETVFLEIKQATENQRPLIELSGEQKEALKTAAGAALAIIAVAGIITVAAVAPNIFEAVDKIHRLVKGKKYSFKEKQAKTAQTFYYLKRHGFIELTHSKEGLMARITGKGKKKLSDLNVETLKIKKPKSWDGKWWVVAADIPTKNYRWAADLFRKKVKQMGFYSLQRTLWFYPYSPTKEIEFLIQHFGIAHFVTVMEVSRIDKDDDLRLRKFFGF